MNYVIIKHLVTWLVYGLFFHTSFSQYKRSNEFVGPPQRSMFDQCNDILNRMEVRLEQNKRDRARTDQFINDVRKRHGLSC